ncbi:MAG: DUF697 domain-containing protein [Thermonemataceae bacterium]
MLEYIAKKIARKLDPEFDKVTKMEEKANKTVTKYVLISMGAGAVPVPLVDIAALTAVQLNMLKELCEDYEADFSEISGKMLIDEIAGTSLIKIGASLVKTIPGLGYLIGGIPMIVVSGASTYALGKVFINHLNKGGTLADFDISEAKVMFKKEFEKGKEFAENLRKNKEQEETPKKSDKSDVVFEKLRQLGELRDKGIVTEEEFEIQKKKLLEQL